MVLQKAYKYINKFYADKMYENNYNNVKHLHLYLLFQRKQLLLVHV